LLPRTNTAAFARRANLAKRFPFAMGMRKGRRQTGRHLAWQSEENLLRPGGVKNDVA